MSHSVNLLRRSEGSHYLSVFLGCEGSKGLTASLRHAVVKVLVLQIRIDHKGFDTCNDATYIFLVKVDVLQMSSRIPRLYASVQCSKEVEW